MNYCVITENDESKWDDKTGIRYNFPNKYINILTEGTEVIYYKGKLKNKAYKSKRLSNDPHYFGIATIGKVTKSKVDREFFAEILNFKKFDSPLSFKSDDKYLEQLNEELKKNYFWDGVRKINLEIFQNIINKSDLNLSISNEELKKYDEHLTTEIKEGKKTVVYSTKYERKKELRDKCLHYHGYDCKVCGMDFYTKYGDIGRGYIHVHHIKPLFTLEKEEVIDPINDLVPVCPNCHSMIHKTKNKVLSINELKDLIKG